jgi:hypothetical protein
MVRQEKRTIKGYGSAARPNITLESFRSSCSPGFDVIYFMYLSTKSDQLCSRQHRYQVNSHKIIAGWNSGHIAFQTLWSIWFCKCRIQSSVFYVVICTSLFVFSFFFLWPLHYLSFFDLRILINPFVSFSQLLQPG